METTDIIRKNKKGYIEVYIEVNYPQQQGNCSFLYIRHLNFTLKNGANFRVVFILEFCIAPHQNYAASHNPGRGFSLPDFLQ
jgi:hypothetical protein